MPRARAVVEKVGGWMVRVCLPGSVLHAHSSTEPRWEGGRVEWTLTEYGDQIAYVDWSAVIAVAWRKVDE